MPDWLLVTLGVIIGLGVIVVTVWFALGATAGIPRNARNDRSTRQEDRGPSVGTSNDPIGGD